MKSYFIFDLRNKILLGRKFIYHIFYYIKVKEKLFLNVSKPKTRFFTYNTDNCI